VRLFEGDRRLQHQLVNAAFALSLAVLIWAGVGARLTRSRSFDIALDQPKIEGLDFQLAAGSARSFKVTIQGSAEVLSSLSDAQKAGIRLRPRITLDRKVVGNKVLEGYRVELDPARDVEIPERFLSRLRAVELSPSLLSFDVSPVVQRSYPAIAPITGQPVQGLYLVGKPRIGSPTVRVNGSLKRILAFESDTANKDAKGRIVVRTRELSLTRAAETFTTFLPFLLPTGLKCVPEGSEVTVRLEAPVNYETRKVTLDVHFLLPPDVKQPWIVEPRPPTKSLSIEIEGRRPSLNEFEQRLRSADPARRPYLLVRLKRGLRPGNQSGQLEIGNFDPDAITLRGDKGFLFTVRKPR